MKYFRILCGRPFGYELCEFDYEALRFGFDLVFDQDLDGQALSSDEFTANIAARHPRNVFVRCNSDQVEPWLELGLQVIVKVDSLVSEKPPFPRTVNMSRVLIEAYDLDHLDLVSEAAPAAVIIKGNEAGGRVGPINNFTFLQAALARCNIPVIVQGGAGKHIIAGLFAAGCAGVLLDHQLALLDEAPTSLEARHAIMSLKADDFAAFDCNQKCYRFVTRTYSPAFDALTEWEAGSIDQLDPSIRDQEIERYIKEHSARNYDEILNSDTLMPAGIDLCFAKHFSDDFFCFKGLREGLYTLLPQVAEDLNQAHPFGPDSRFAREHHIKYPIFQGPMANVSDVAEFAVEVTNAGAMPFLAVGYLPAQESARMVERYRSLAPDQPLGLGLVGIFETFDGYTKIDEAIAYGPQYAIMAGGFVNYGRRLENAGIKTYLHTPSKEIFLDTIAGGISGVILEGNEAGGHISKLSSFSLWQSCLYALESKGRLESNKSIVLAGGITGEAAVQFCAGLVSSFKDYRVSFGLQAGSLFLTCREIVTSGALDARYQDLVLSSNGTVVTGSTVGLPQRQIRTPRVETIIQWESSHDRSRDYKTIRMEYEANNRGGLRIAAKSEIFNCRCFEDKSAPTFLGLDDEERYFQDGLFYAGQNVCLLNSCKSLPEIMEEMFSRAARPFKPGFELNPAFLSREDKIAVVGLGCFLPDSPSTVHFWHNVKQGTCSIREVPPNIWDSRFYYDPDKAAPNKTYSRIGAFVDDSLFDPITYGIMPKTAKDLTRAQKFALMAVKEALDRIGIEYAGIDRAKVGVFLGSSFTPEICIDSVLPIQADLIASLLNDLPGFPSSSHTILDGVSRTLESRFHEVTEDTLPNTLSNFLSARISHTFGFNGPNFTSDAACASSMAAIQNAVDALRARRVDLAIAGSANGSTDIWTYVGFSKSGALSPDLSCPFDERANGFVIGEGAGVLLLKRLEDAVREDDPILGIIAGIGTSSDGGAKGITAPNAEGQALALKRAYRDAAISPATIGFVEAHGTSTQLGDITEFNALTEV